MANSRKGKGDNGMESERWDGMWDVLLVSLLHVVDGVFEPCFL